MIHASVEYAFFSLCYPFAGLLTRTTPAVAVVLQERHSKDNAQVWSGTNPHHYAHKGRTIPREGRFKQKSVGHTPVYVLPSLALALIPAPRLAPFFLCPVVSCARMCARPWKARGRLEGS